MKNNIYYVIAYGYDNKHFSEFLHISSNNKHYFMLGAKIGDLKLYKSLKCAIKKAKKIRPLFPKYRNITILKVIDGRITSDSIVEQF